MARKFDTAKIISDREIIEQCFACNDDFLDMAYVVYAEKYKNYSEKWLCDNWDSFEDSLFARIKLMKESMLYKVDAKK